MAVYGNQQEAFYNNSSQPIFDVLHYGAFFDTHIWYAVSATNGASPQVITCPNSDCNFTRTVQPGMRAWGLSANGSVFVNGLNIPVGTVLSVQNDNQITVSGTVAGACSGNCALAVGHDDTPGIAAAWAAASSNCGQLSIPAKIGQINMPIFNDFAVGNGGCQSNGGRNTRQTPSIKGSGSTTSMIVMAPDFNTAGCTFKPASTYPVPGCIGCPTNGFGITISGVGFTGLGASPNNAAGLGIMCSGVVGGNWGLSDVQCTGFHGFRYGLMVGGGTTILGNQGGAVDFDGCGGDDGNANQAVCGIFGDNLQITGLSFCGDSSGPGLTIGAAGSSIGFGQFCSTGSVAVSIASGAVTDLHGVRIGGNPCPSVNNQTGISAVGGVPELNMYGGQIAAGAGGTGGVGVASTSVPFRANFSGVFFVNEPSSTCFNAANIMVIRDLDNNRFSCGTFLTGASTFSRVGFGSEGRSPLGSGALTLTGWGSGASASCAAFSTNALSECTITVGSSPSANPTIQYTWTNNTDSGAFSGFGIQPSTALIQVGGTQAVVNWTRTAISATSATFQFTGTPTNANTVIIQARN